LKKLFLKNWRDLKTRKAQFVALIIIVALGIISFIATINAYKNLFTSYEFVYEKLNFADYTVKFEFAPQKILEKVKGIKGVSKAEGRLVFDTTLQIKKDEFAQARLIGLPSDKHPEVNDIKIEKGSYLQKEKGNVAVVEKHFADYYNKKPGDFIYPIINGKKVKLKVIGIASSPEYLIVSPSRQEVYASARRFAVLFVPQENLENYLGLKQTINEVSVLLEKDAQKSKVTKRVKEILSPYGIIESFTKEEQPSNAALELDLEGYREIAYMLPMLILIIASFSIYISLSRLVRSQRKEIGLMKALGYSNASIVWHYLSFSLIISILGSIIGIVLGQWASGEITKVYASELGIPLVKTAFYPEYALQAIIISLFFCLAAGFVPAISSARLRPAEAMHSDPSLGIQKGYVPLMERVFSIFFSPPFWLKIPVRNLFRVRKRTLYTVLGIIFAFILTLSSWSFFDAMDWILNHQIERVERWDMQAFFKTPQNPEIARKIEKWSGVKKVECALQLPATLKTEEEVDTILTALKPSANFHRFSIAEGTSVKKALSEGKIIITPFVAKKLGVEVGDKITVETPWGKKKFIVGATNEEFLGAPAFIDYEKGLELANLPFQAANAFYLKIEREKESEIKKKLVKLPGATEIQVKRLIIEDWKELMGLFYVFIGVTVLFAFAMAFIVVFNTLNTSVLEREREIATMRTLGESKGKIALMITIENLIAGLIALPFGLILGTLTAVEMMKAFESELFAMKPIIYTMTYVIVSALIFAVLFASEIPAVRQVFRLKLAEATKIVE
jgi:putative ABC transport system permease protein